MQRQIGKMLVTIMWFLWLLCPCIHLTGHFILTPSHHPSYYKSPTCVDLATTYSCFCGPSFVWNTRSCVANGLNSHFEFPTNGSSMFHYSLLTNQPMPSLYNFTISFWIQVLQPSYSGIILSYYDRGSNQTLLTLKSGKTLSMRVRNKSVTSSIHLLPSQWTHVTWIWINIKKESEWSLYINAELRASGRIKWKTSERWWLQGEDAFLPGGGVLVLGQSSAMLVNLDAPFHPSFLQCCRLQGNISFLNVWDYSLDKKKIQRIKNDCKVEHAGNAVQWSSFRTGTRSIRISWPTPIHDVQRCFNERTAVQACNKYCSFVKGQKCSEEVLSHVTWKRSLQGSTVVRKCFGDRSGFNDDDGGRGNGGRSRGDSSSSGRSYSDYINRDKSKIDISTNNNKNKDTENIMDPSFHDVDDKMGKDDEDGKKNGDDEDGERRNNEKMKRSYMMERNKGVITRECMSNKGGSKGQWGFPVVKACIAPSLLKLQSQIKTLSTGEYPGEKEMTTLMRKLFLWLQETRNDGPVGLYDLGSTLECLNSFLQLQYQLLGAASSELSSTSQESQEKLKKNTYLYHSSLFGLSRSLDINSFPTLSYSVTCIKTLARSLDSLLKKRHTKTWLHSNPPGSELDKLLQTVNKVTDLASTFLHVHMSRGNNKPYISYPFLNNIDLKTELFIKTSLQFTYFPNKQHETRINKEEINYSDVEIIRLNDESEDESGMYNEIEDRQDNNDDDDGLKMNIYDKSDDKHEDKNYKEMDWIKGSSLEVDLNQSVAKDEEMQYEAYSVGIFKVSLFLNKNPHDLMNQRVNSVIFLFTRHKPQQPQQPPQHIQTHHNSFNLSIFITFSLQVSSNISNTRCVLFVSSTRRKLWGWTSDYCRQVYSNLTHVVCRCVKEGYYGILSDLYDVNYVPPEEDLTCITLPSYIGSLVLIYFCCITLTKLIYYRTRSSACLVHRQFAVALVLQHTTLLFATERIKMKFFCMLIAPLQHYLITSTFCWLMNESFNLYILITYAAHSRSNDQFEDEQSMLKYHLIGWILPFFFVGAYYCATYRNYVSDTMCFITMEKVWYLITPVVVILLVSVLVLIVTMKEQMESSYSKNETTNRHIGIYSKALWTQAVLMLMTTLLTVISLKYRGYIIQVIVAMFNILQGVFFYTFFYCLNEEVSIAPTKREFFSSKKRNSNYTTAPKSMEILWDREHPRKILPDKSDKTKLLRFKEHGNVFEMDAGRYYGREVVENDSDDEQVCFHREKVTTV